MSHCAYSSYIGTAWVCLACLFVNVELACAQSVDPWAEARERMVQEEVSGAGVTDERVCDAMRATPRHEFVATSQRHLAYFDLALPLGKSGQTISPPFVVASMTQALDPQPSDRVLEIGTGSGYQAAVLSHLVAEVYSIEIVAPLGRSAERRLRRLEYRNVYTKIGDGYQGWAEHAPFDKIIVTCSPESVPQPLVDQLREGGVIVIPLGQRYQQALCRLRKVSGELQSEVLEPTFFVPMTGRAEQLRREKPDVRLPELINGGFEELTELGLPKGWYYVRQATAVKDANAPADQCYLRFANETPGRGAQALQALGIDGRYLSKLELSAMVRVKNVQYGTSEQERPTISLNFFDEDRALLVSQALGPWSGTSDWQLEKEFVRVPSQCRLAVVAIGLFGAVGELSIDQLSLRVVEE